MCDRPPAAPRRRRMRFARWVVAPVALAVVFARAGAAQDVAQLGARVFSASHAVNVARDSVDAILERMRAAAIPRDSIQAGAITVRFTAAKLPPATRAMLARAARTAWSETQLGLGDAAARVDARLPIVVKPGGLSYRLAPVALHFELPGRATAGTAFTTPLSDAEGTAGIVELIGDVAALDEPPALKAVGGDWIPAAGLSSADWANAAINLATETSAVTRDCYAGSVSRCESALALTDVQDPLTEWYSPADWRVIVARMPVVARERPERRARLTACLGGNAPDVCETLARETQVSRPLTTSTRRTLIGLALEIGGPKAYDRMTGAHGSALEVLAATSGIGADDLVARWRERVLAATPERVRPRALEATVMLGWTLLLAAAAARRRP